VTRVRDKVPKKLRDAAWLAINRMPARAQRLFRHTDAHKIWQMKRLYERQGTPAAEAPTILFWIPGGMPLLLHVETVIAAALRLRGYNVHAIICDSPYRACVLREVTDGTPLEKWRDSCASCIASNRHVLDLMGIPYSFIGDYVPPEKREELWARTEGFDLGDARSLTHDGLYVGHNVTSTITRYLQGAELNGNADIVREYSYTALVTAEAAKRVYDQLQPARVFMSHGVYVDWGPALQTALKRGIPVTGWKASYLSARFFFRHVHEPDRIDFHKLSNTAWARRLEKPLSAVEEASLKGFLDRRYHQRVSFDMKKMHHYSGDIARIRKKYDIKDDKPVWGVMAHINWDSVSDYAPMAYASFDDWMVDTIDRVSRQPEVQWVIKIHPVEAYDNPASGVQRLIQNTYPNLPPHVKVIPAEEELSPLDFFELVDGGVTVYGTSGLEMCLLGKPVILAGEAHYSGKGFTHDGLTIDCYRSLLESAGAIGRLSSEQVRLARLYAYSYFVARQVPIPMVRDRQSIWWRLQANRRDLLLPGADPFLDFICEHLVNGEDFVMDSKLVALAESDAWG
jgi:hypothetical protein